MRHCFWGVDPCLPPLDKSDQFSHWLEVRFDINGKECNMEIESFIKELRLFLEPALKTISEKGVSFSSAPASLPQPPKALPVSVISQSIFSQNGEKEVSEPKQKRARLLSPGV
jgi:hypothetical protein